MKLIIIEGATATGKSTLARKLAGSLRITAFLKDDYKEREFDRIGKDLSLKQGKKIEEQSWREVFTAVERAIQANESIIVEGNFFHSHKPRFGKLIKPGVTVVEIYCYARGRTVLGRFIGRNITGERHPGHKDYIWYPSVALQAAFMGPVNHYRPLRLTPRLLKVNTDDFAAIDYPAVCRFIRAAE